MGEEFNKQGQEELPTKEKLFSLWSFSNFTVNKNIYKFLFLFISLHLLLEKRIQSH